MHKSFAFLCILYSLYFNFANAQAQPRDLIEEAYNQLDELKGLIEGDILAAHDDLQTLDTSFAAYTNNVVTEGTLSIQEEHGTVIVEINTLKELANGAGKDVTTCTDSSEELLNRLPFEYTQTLVDCTTGLVSEVSTLVKDGRYFIDVNINKVYNYENQLRRCGDSITCIQPIVTDIQLDNVRLPANIKTEVTAVASQLSIVKVLVDQCSDTEVTSYVGAANSVLSDVTVCINKILDRP